MSKICIILLILAGLEASKALKYTRLTLTAKNNGNLNGRIMSKILITIVFYVKISKKRLIILLNI